MTLSITPLYAGILTLLLIALSARVITYRISKGISLGDGTDKALLQRMRVQANCAEYAPLGILLMALSELQGAPALVLHLLGGALFLGRILHAVGFGSWPQNMVLRKTGMALTLGMLALAALGNIAHSLL